MLVLLVDDEAGIRDGLASFLRLKGHVVQVAATCAEGVELASGGGFDVVVTDWRLGDGLGSDIVAACRCPVVVMSGYPDDVDARDERVVVLRKPVRPAVMLDEIEQRGPLAGGPRTAPPTPESTQLAALPPDARDRVRLAVALAADCGGATVAIDDSLIVLRAPWPGDDEHPWQAFGALGGDLRVITTGSSRQLELRLYRDGRPQSELAIQPGDPWPGDRAEVSVDVPDSTTPAAFIELVDQVARERARGRTVHLLNVPSHLRLYLELLGRDHLVPKRIRSGPRLPEVLVELWNQE